MGYQLQGYNKASDNMATQGHVAVQGKDQPLEGRGKA